MPKQPEYLSPAQYLVENEDDVKFSKVFCSAAQSQNNIKTCLKNLINTEIKEDKTVKDVIKQAVREVESENWKLQLKSWGNRLERLIWLVVGALLAYFLK